MSAQQRRSTRVWVLVAVAAVAVITVIVVAIVAFSTRPATPDPAASTRPSGASTPAPSTQSDDDDAAGAGVDGRGWVPEPATTDPDEYARAALAAAGTFDTTLSSRDAWLSYLDSWFTPDPRYTSDADRTSRMEKAQLELRQTVVLPEAMWVSLAEESGAVVTAVVGELALSAAPDDATQSIATGDVELTFTRTSPSGEESSYTEVARVSVQVLCGPESAPTPGAAQRAGDCKVVRFFPEPIEG